MISTRNDDAIVADALVINNIGLDAGSLMSSSKIGTAIKTGTEICESAGMQESWDRSIKASLKCNRRLVNEKWLLSVVEKILYEIYHRPKALADRDFRKESFCLRIWDFFSTIADPPD
jgi:hypothetical protein